MSYIIHSLVPRPAPQLNFVACSTRFFYTVRKKAAEWSLGTRLYNPSDVDIVTPSVNMRRTGASETLSVWYGQFIGYVCYQL